MLHVRGDSAAGGALLLTLLLSGGATACKLDQLVTPPPPAKISVSPPTLEDSAVVGSPTAVSRVLAVVPEGPDHISWTATTVTNSPWLVLKNTAAEAPGTLSLNLLPGSLPAGSYADTVVVAPDGWEDRAVRIPVTFMVRVPVVRLAFTTQPSDTRVGSAIAPAVVVTARDVAGKTLTAWTGTVTIGLANNPAGGTLSGTLSATASAGVARFANLSLNRSGTGYSLRATSGDASVTSGSFNVRARGSGSTSTVSSSGGSIDASDGSAPAVITVTARDDQGTTLPDVPVTVAVTGSANSLAPSSGTTNAAGVFVSMFSSTKAEPKTISATVDDVPIIQPAVVTVNPAAAATLVFSVDPSNTVAFFIITPPVTVITLDAFGNRAVSYSRDVSIELAPTESNNPRLNGDRRVQAIDGVAVFGDLSVTRPGTGFRLIASAPGLTDATSQSFTVSPLF